MITSWLALLTLCLGKLLQVYAVQNPQEILLDAPGIGLLRGAHYPSHQLRIFAGIPYAEAPVGDLRWRPPKPVSDSKGVLDARSFGPACPQEIHGELVGDENCLTLNVFAPSADGSNLSNASLPVLVWFHGGSYSIGSANVDLNGTWSPLYSGEALAGEGSVVVTVQYRLGALGFLGSTKLRERDPSKSSGNYGVQDQRLALRWVRQHIASFGGDPDRVLIFGQSAGAGSVNWHLVAGASRGLFHAAALQSGACSPWASQTWHSAETTFDAVLGLVNCTNVACLLGKSAKELAGASHEAENMGLLWAPTVDGIELTELPCERIEKGDCAKVPVIVGFTRDESAPYGNTNVTEQDFDSILQAQVPKHLRPRIKAEYSARYSEWYWAAHHFTADADVSCPTRRFARAAEALGSPVYAYKWSRQPSFPLELMMGADIAPRRLWGAFHGAELAFVFGNPHIRVWNTNLTNEERRLASKIRKHWVTLAKAGKLDPDDWPLVSGGRLLSRTWLLLDSVRVSVSETELLSQCDTIDEIGIRRSTAIIV